MIANSTPGILRWGQVLQRGDLPIFVTDAAGNPLDPYSITYTLFFQEKNAACPRHVGPCRRVPVKADVGEYYVTGIAGECGQPGDWYVEWTLQEYFEGTLMAERFGFKVFDTSAYCTPGPHYEVRSGCRPCGRNRNGW